MKKAATIFILLFLSANALALSTSGTNIKLTKMYTYKSSTLNYGGSIIVKVDATISDCEDGFWLSETDLNENRNLSAFLLSAFHAKSPIYFSYTTDRAPGISGNKYCRANSVGLE